MAAERKKVMMMSEGLKENGEPTKYCYYTTRSGKPDALAKGKLKLRKFDPVIRQHVIFTEKKVPK